MNFPALPASLALAAALLPLPAGAADEHGHDHDTPPAQGAPALPRFAAVSEAFELVGVLDGRRLTVYLDRFADNAPVEGATVDLEIGGVKVAARRQPDGAYEALLAEAPRPGAVAVTATIVAGAETDLLAGELDLHEAAEPAAHSGDRRGIFAWGSVALAALVAVAWAVRRRFAARRLRSVGAAP